MGAVYCCHHFVTDRLRAAVKVTRLEDVQHGTRWFLREVEALARLRHPGIVGIRSPGVDADRGLLFLAMELVEGETLLHLLRRGGMTLDTFRRTFGGVAEALAFAHSHGIYHRDIKPANIMLRPDGSPVLVDFGVSVDMEAVAEDPEARMGTPSYMPPEAFMAGVVDPAKADIYALGVLMHEVLSGKRAFERIAGGDETHYQNIKRQKMATTSLDPGERAPDDLRALVRAATIPLPVERVITMEALATGLLRGEVLSGMVTPGSLGGAAMGPVTLTGAASGPSGAATAPAAQKTQPIPEGSGTLVQGDSGEWVRWVIGAVVVAVLLSVIAGELTWWWTKGL